MRVVLNRETEKIIFHPPLQIKFALRTGKRQDGRGDVIFGSEAVRQMNLKLGCYVEFELEDTLWFVSKSDNDKTGYRLSFLRKGRGTLTFGSNRIVRGFLAQHKLPINKWNVCHLEKEGKGQYNYPRYKIVVDGKETIE